MRRSVLIASLLLALIAVLHLVRLVFGVSLQIAGDEVSRVVSLLAILVFGGSAAYLWKDTRSDK